MNAIILGAGASKSYKESPTGFSMPVAKDFFETFNNLEISRNPWVLIGDILNFGKYEKNIDVSKFFSIGIDIEVFHSEVEEKLLSVLDNYTDDIKKTALYSKAYNQLIFLFSSVVNEIQNGPISIPHTNIANLLTSEDYILTFNWDTLMDRALNEVTNWKVDYGYGLKPKNIFRDGWVPPMSNQNSKSPCIIKLHGSSNWLTSHTIFDPETKQITLSQVASHETLFVYEYSTKPYSTYDGRYMPGYQAFSYGYYPPNLLTDPGKSAGKNRVIVNMKYRFPWNPKGIADSSGLVSMPLIIPPVKQKKYAFYGNLFKKLWEKAEDVLSSASKIIIIGYSFPDTDYQSNDLFLNAFMRRSTFPQIYIINPEPEPIHYKFKSAFGVPENNIRIYKECFSDRFDLNNIVNN